MSTAPISGNRLLDQLPEAERTAMLRGMKRVSIPIGETLFRQGRPVRHVHFPINGVLSLVTRLSDGSAIEVTTIGNEGTTAASVFLGAATSAPAECVAQIVGDHLVMPADDFRDAVGPTSALHQVMNHYLAVLLVQVGQAVACNRLHNTKQRSARWLLMIHDRVGSDRFFLTHEFLGFMLGIRRASVSDAMATLRKAGLVGSVRGHIEIRDRAALEATACECYTVMHRAHEDLK
ncbi:MAG TPA: Crp/Fnr family transcriptional regulator [Actinomycetota bacterium]